MPAELEQVFDPEAGPPRGLLKTPPSEGRFRHLRRCPVSALNSFIEHYWSVEWDLRGLEPHTAETLPHPNVHLVFETSGSVIVGVPTGKFTRTLEGRSLVFGVKFRLGGFYPFLKSPISALMDRMVPANDIFGKSIEGLEKILLSTCDEEEKLEAANAFFLVRIPEVDNTIELATQLVAHILRESQIKTVDDLVRFSGLGKRSLQRVFQEYVGVPPKWVIRRYRLHEVVERIKSGEALDWASLALELGYFDQAHLINDFRTMVGYSPSQYQKQVLTGR